MTQNRPSPRDRTLTEAPRRVWPTALGGLILTLTLAGTASVVAMAPVVEPHQAPLGHNLGGTSLRMSRAYWFVALVLQGYEARPFLTLADAR